MRFSTAPLLALALTSVLALAGPVPNEEDSFQNLARRADDEDLHAALHAKKEFQHGIFPHDRHALEAVRRDHEDEALKIVKFALMRRQDNSTTTTTTSTTSTTATESTTSVISDSISSDSVSATETSTTVITTVVSTDTVTETSTETATPTEVVLTPTSFTTTLVTTITNSLGEQSTLYETQVVVITPTPPAPGTSSTTTKTTGPPSLQTNAVGILEAGWAHLGMAVVAGVGGLML